MKNDPGDRQTEYLNAGIEVEIKAVTAAVYFSSDVANADTAPHFYAALQVYTWYSRADPGLNHEAIPVEQGTPASALHDVTGPIKPQAIRDVCQHVQRYLPLYR